MTDKPTDLQAALREACKDANENIIAALNGTTSIKHMGPAVFECIARCYERHLTPVVEALRDSVIEECAEIARPVDDVLAGVILKLKGAPR